MEVNVGLQKFLIPHSVKHCGSRKLSGPGKPWHLAYNNEETGKKKEYKCRPRTTSSTAQIR
jgi:hypothetical protein